MSTVFNANFPRSVLANILLHLPHGDLLRAQRVSKLFSTVINENTAIAVQIFKQRSDVFVASLVESSEPEKKKNSKQIYQRPTEPYQLHPLISRSGVYFLSNTLNGVALPVKKASKKRSLSIRKWPRLKGLPVGPGDDFISIPAVKAIKLESIGPAFNGGGFMVVSEDNNGFNVTVKNSNGIRVADFFEALAEASGVGDSEPEPEGLEDDDYYDDYYDDWDERVMMRYGGCNKIVRKGEVLSMNVSIFM
ncbi:F-box domain-containing protein [Mycena chlorophos]|uniref:F-box domain-containing protein n=1 Tax=Mycena chlorophos TaxID=658473 RepID=A0A8H6WN50_MYCCL|nr:F-box domain-containing protein [Mycena chlorophos]